VNTTLWYTITNSAPLTALTVTPSLPSPQAAHTPITFTATANGGVNVQYSFWIYNQNATPAWSQLQANSSQTTCPWTPAAAGSYLLSVTAQEGAGACGEKVNVMQWYVVQ